MIKAILFDLDNTLIDFWKMKKLSCEAAASAMIDAGLDEDKEKILEMIFKIYDEHGFEDPMVFQKVLEKKLGKIDYKILASSIVAYRKVREGFMDPYPNVTSTLLELKMQGKKLAIVTDAPRLKAWIRLVAMKLHHLFDVVVAYEDTKLFKPSKMPFKAALNALNLRPEECLMVGDWPERDIAGAKRLGIKTCFAKYGNTKVKKTNADFEIGDVKEILGIVR